MLKIAEKFFIWLHNFSYKAISKIAIKKNGGIHPKHEILNYHEFFVAKVDENDAVLDLGCGNGLLAYDLAGKARKVIGMDILSANIDKAKKHNKQGNLEFMVGDATVYPFNEKFDKIVLSNVLEHIENRIDFLKKLRDLSDEILIRVPLIDRDWLAVYKKKNGYEYRLDKTHFVEYTVENLRKELIEAGWNLDDYSIRFGEMWGTVGK
ncbi:MAG TPA: class I SAM-dependent methyltransferase [Candidatus Bipolaricaulota bacterium]|nr:class I SAM-dependent methyltransferase [Candidatus Bipolaricaulota bacterium]